MFNFDIIIFIRKKNNIKKTNFEKNDILEKRAYLVRHFIPDPLKLTWAFNPS